VVGEGWGHLTSGGLGWEGRRGARGACRPRAGIPPGSMDEDSDVSGGRREGCAPRGIGAGSQGGAGRDAGYGGLEGDPRVATTLGSNPHGPWPRSERQRHCRNAPGPGALTRISPRIPWRAFRNG
jgi:hypothetical protein